LRSKASENAYLYKTISGLAFGENDIQLAMSLSPFQFSNLISIKRLLARAETKLFKFSLTLMISVFFFKK
jgi:hypothetical protein